MGITQRTIYIGVGGTGLKIGEHLERAMRREICGVDGDNLRRVGGAFAGFSTFEIPAFFQSVYADFAASELESLRGRLAVSQVADRTSSFAKNLIPAVASSTAASRYLRTNHSNSTSSWLPAEDGGEPQIAPLSAGAGQFPTVGRVSLFHSLATAGFASVIGGQLQGAISKIVGSMGQLNALAAGNATDQVVVYVGFSVSGGTGCGIAYDIIHLVGSQLSEHFGSNFRIIPMVVLPSAFDMLNEGKQIAAKLNAARALADLQRLVDHQLTEADVESFTVSYPGIGPVHLAAGTIPGIFVFDKSVGITQTDLLKSIAENILSQVSSTNGDDGGFGNVQSWIESAVNDVPKRREPHGSGVGLKPFVPSMSLSLSTPVEVVSNLLALRLIQDGLRDLTAQANVVNENNQSLIELFLNQVGPEIEGVIKGRRPPNVNLQLAPGSGKSLVDGATGQYYNQARNVATSVPNFAKQQLGGALSPSWSAGVEAVLGAAAGSGLKVIRVINGDGAIDEKYSRGGALNYLVELSSDAEKPIPAAFKCDFLPLKPSTSDPKVLEWRKSIDAWLDAAVVQAWRAEWRRQSGAWKPSIDAFRAQMARVKSRMESLQAETAGEYSQLITQLEQPATCVADFLPFPSANISAAVEEMSTKLRTRIAAKLGLESPSAGQLFDRIIASSGDGWRSVWLDYLESNDVEALTLRLRKVLTQAVREALVDSEAIDGPILPMLGELLRRAANGDTSSVVQALNVALNNLMPTGVFPARKGGDPMVLVSYPGLQDAKVEEYLRKILGTCADLVSLAPSLVDTTGTDARGVTFAPTGTQGECLTITASVVGQGLLDVAESLECQRVWRRALNGELHAAIDGAGAYLSWRQRLSPSDLARLTSRLDRIRILQAVIGGLWSGSVTARFDVSADLRRPSLLEFRQPDAAGAAALAAVDLSLRLNALDGLSTWPSIFMAWEQAALDAQQISYETMRRLLGPITPNGWVPNVGELPDPGSEIDFLMNQCDEELQLVADTERSFGPSIPSGIRIELQNHYQFWGDILPAAIENKVHDGGFETYGAAYRWKMRDVVNP